MVITNTILSRNALAPAPTSVNQRAPRHARDAIPAVGVRIKSNSINGIITITQCRPSPVLHRMWPSSAQITLRPLPSQRIPFVLSSRAAIPPPERLTTTASMLHTSFLLHHHFTGHCLEFCSKSANRGRAASVEFFPVLKTKQQYTNTGFCSILVE